MTPAGLSLLKRHEGLRLKAYRDVAGVWTIGYGHTGPDVHDGLVITGEQAEQLLLADVREAQDALSLVTVPLTDAQKDALTSFIFNVGVGAFKGSTLLRKLNAGDYLGAADEFPRWNKAGGRVVAGLSKRRADERHLFMFDQPKPQVAPMPLPVAPIVAAFLPELIKAAPELIRAFGKPGSESAERNAKAFEVVGEILKDSTGEPTVEGGVVAVKEDPAAAQQFRTAVQEWWYELQEAGGGGIAGAREYNLKVIESGVPLYKQPAFVVSVLLLVPVYAMLADVFFIHSEAYSEALRTQIVTAVIALTGIVGAFWLGSSASSRTKDEILANK
jgi:lysozyme